ncbi:MAG: phosphatidate cytidylyltransferase [Clostridia bacterium]|nr:phosphatidate cytidylyltransferase [Clostridia bacterium]
MIKRTLTGAVIVSVIYTWIFFSYIPAVLYIGTAVLCMSAMLEIYRICSTDKRYFIYILLIVSALLLGLPIPNYEYLMMLILPLAMILFGIMMVLKERIHDIGEWRAMALGSTVVLLFKSIPIIRERENGSYYLTFAVTACFVTDIAALLFGKAFGSHKLCPKISPRKTVEGAIGGVACTVLIAVIAAVLLEKYGILYFDMGTLVAWSIFVSVAGQFGDLCMSVVKRIAGVKDFGNLLPGHGGILDRFDSHMFAISFTLVFCSLTGGFILQRQ